MFACCQYCTFYNKKNRCSNVEQEELVPTTPIVQHAFNEVQLCIKVSLLVAKQANMAQLKLIRSERQQQLGFQESLVMNPFWHSMKEKDRSQIHQERAITRLYATQKLEGNQTDFFKALGIVPYICLYLLNIEQQRNEV